MFHNPSCVLDDLAAKEVLSFVEMHLYQLARVKQPVIVVRQANGLVPHEVADILASRVGVLGTEHCEATVVGKRHTHHPDTREATTLGGRLANHGQPVLEPAEVNGHTRDELAQRFRLIRRVVLISRLQPEGRVLHGSEELAKFGAGLDELTQRSSSAYLRA